MPTEPDLFTHRILVIDDNPTIHEDYRKILAGHEDSRMSAAEAALFREQQPSIGRPTFDLDSAMQGRDGVERARVGARRRPPVFGCFCRHAHAARVGWTGDDRTPVGDRPGDTSGGLLRLHRL